MVNGQYRPGDVVLGKWKLTKLIGEGSFGKVFEADREDFGRTYKAAIKIVTIPQSQSEVQSIRADGLDDESVTTYFRGFVEEMVGEFALMEQLKGTANVVGYEDHEVLQHENQVGWDIFIRMELLTPLLRQVQSGSLSREQVQRLGIDLCRALELCRKHKIVHRDIKPENIFISENGDYKLGDFGIARTVEKTTGGLSKKGTYTYMAPEVYTGKPYGASADLYSLGLVLYWLTNRHRAPFLPLPPEVPGYNDREEALRRRMSGEVLPDPCDADEPLAAVIRKACAFAPKDRYKSPTELRQALEALAGGTASAEQPEPTEGVFPDASEGTDSIFSDAPEGTESIFGDAPEGTESIFHDVPEGTDSIFPKEPKQPPKGPSAPPKQKLSGGAVQQKQQKKTADAVSETPAPEAGSRAALAVCFGFTALLLSMMMGSLGLIIADPWELLAYNAVLGLLAAVMAFASHTQHASAPVAMVAGGLCGSLYSWLAEAPQYGQEVVTFQSRMLVVTVLMLALLWGVTRWLGKKRSSRFGPYLPGTMVALVWALLPNVAPGLCYGDPAVVAYLLRSRNPAVTVLLVAVALIAYAVGAKACTTTLRPFVGRKLAALYMLLAAVAWSVTMLLRR